MSTVIVGKTRLTFDELMAIKPDDKGWRVVMCGARIKVGDGARIGDRARIGDCARIGDFATIGDFARIGDRARIGDCARIGDRAQGVLADLGREQGRGYGRVAYIAADGSARITAGCRDFSIPEARAHWGPAYKGPRKTGDEYLSLIDHVERLAAIRAASDQDASVER